MYNASTKKYDVSHQELMLYIKRAKVLSIEGSQMVRRIYESVKRRTGAGDWLDEGINNSAVDSCYNEQLIFNSGLRKNTEGLGRIMRDAFRLAFIDEYSDRS